MFNELKGFLEFKAIALFFSSLGLVIIFFFSAGDQIQGFLQAKQVLYH